MKFEQYKFEKLESLKCRLQIPEGFDKEKVIRIYDIMAEWLVYDTVLDEFEKGFLTLLGIYDDVINIIGKKEVIEASKVVWKNRLKHKPKLC